MILCFRLVSAKVPGLVSLRVIGIIFPIQMAAKLASVAALSPIRCAVLGSGLWSVAIRGVSGEAQRGKRGIPFCED